MAEIRDELQLDVSRALASIQEVENALNRALSNVVVDVETGAGLGQLDSEIAAATDEAQQLSFELDEAEDSADALQSEMRGVEKATDKAADESERLSKETRKAQGFAGELRDSLTKGFDLKSGVVAAIAALGAREVVQGLSRAVDAATDLSESTNAVRVIFGEASEQVLQFGADTSDAVFLAASEFNQLAAVTGNLLQGFGLGAQEAADLTIQLTERAGDLASVFNTEVGEALEAINAALRGETEQIRRFTGSFSVEEVKRFGRELFGVTGELTEQQKVLSAVEFILQKTSSVQGDAANTAGELANQQRQLTEVWTNAQAAIGQALVPALTELVPLLISAANAIPQLVRNTQDVVTITEGLVGGVVNVGQAGAALLQLDFAQVGNQLGDAADSSFRFFDTLVGSRSILRDFQSLLADGEDNVTDYANALDTVARKGDLLRLFDEITDAASNAGVGIEAQASALRTLVREGNLTDQQLRFLKNRFIELAEQLGRTDLIGEGTEFTFSTLQSVFNATTVAVDGLVSSTSGLEDVQFEEGVANSIQAAADAADEFRESELNAAFELAAEGADKLDERIEALPELVVALGEATGTSTSGLFGIAEGFEEAATQADRFRTLTLELTDPVFAAAQAQERLTEAVEKEAEISQDAQASAQDRANAELDVAKAALEADAALRGLGDINLVGGRFDRSVSVLATALGTTRQEILDILEDAEVLDQTAIGPQVEFLVDDEELERSLSEIPDEVSVAIRYETAGLPAPLSPGAVDELDPRFAGGTALQVNTYINNPTDSDISGNAAQAGNVVAGIVGGTQAFRGRQ